MTSFGAVPATGGRVFVRVGAGPRVGSITALTGASAAPRRASLAVVGAALRVGGTSWASTTDALPAWPFCTADELVTGVRQVLKGFSLLGVVVPRQRTRERVSVLGTAMGNTVVLKVAAEAGPIDREAEALGRLSTLPIPSIATARLLEHGRVLLGDVAASAVAMEHVHGLQRPAWSAPLQLFGRHLSERLGDLPRPAGTPDDWTPQHGDLSPWNLRRTARGLALYDWEGCTWAPANTDRAYFESCVAAMKRGPAPSMSSASHQYLLDMIDQRAGEAGSIDAPLRAVLDAAEVRD
jgi:hypothetical protein